MAVDRTRKPVTLSSLGPPPAPYSSKLSAFNRGDCVEQRNGVRRMGVVQYQTYDLQGGLVCIARGPPGLLDAIPLLHSTEIGSSWAMKVCESRCQVSYIGLPGTPRLVSASFVSDATGTNNDYVGNNPRFWVAGDKQGSAVQCM